MMGSETGFKDIVQKNDIFLSYKRQGLPDALYPVENGFEELGNSQGNSQTGCDPFSQLAIQAVLP